MKLEDLAIQAEKEMTYGKSFSLIFLFISTCSTTGSECFSFIIIGLYQICFLLLLKYLVKLHIFLNNVEP